MHKRSRLIFGGLVFPCGIHMAAFSERNYPIDYEQKCKKVNEVEPSIDASTPTPT